MLNFLSKSKNLPRQYEIKWKNEFKFILKQDDLTIQETDIIVNAANNDLWLGGGVAGAIRQKGGDSIQKECREIIKKNGGPLSYGDVVSTGVGNFKNKNLRYIFHANGPVYDDGNRGESHDLELTFTNCFLLADKLNCESISIPPISSGIFGYPKSECAEIFYECLEKFVDEKIEKNQKLVLKEVRMTIIDNVTFDVFFAIHEKKVMDFADIFRDEIVEMSIKYPEDKNNVIKQSARIDQENKTENSYQDEYSSQVDNSNSNIISEASQFSSNNNYSCSYNNTYSYLSSEINEVYDQNSKTSFQK